MTDDQLEERLVTASISTESGSAAPLLVRSSEDEASGQTTALPLLRRVLMSLGRPGDKRTVAEGLVTEVAAFAGAGAAFLALPEASGGKLRIATATGELASRVGEVVPVSGSIEGAAFESQKVVSTSTGLLAAVMRSNLLETDHLPAGRSIAVPLISSGRSQGVLLLASLAKPRLPWDELSENLELLSEPLGAVLENLAWHEDVRLRAQPQRPRTQQGSGRMASEIPGPENLQQEINNALAVVTAQAQLLLGGDLGELSDSTLASGLQEIYEHGRRTAELVREIAALTSSRLGGFRADVAMTPHVRAILDCLPDGVLVTNSDGVVGFANLRMHEILGAGAGKLVGHVIDDILQPPVAAALRTSVRQIGRQDAKPVEVKVTREGASQRQYGIFSARLGQEKDGTQLWLTTFDDVTEHKEAERTIRESALRDPLTQLANRTLLLERLGHAIARAKRHPHQKFAVLFLDLDNFKLVNDNLGHAAGDALLVMVAKRLQEFLRPEDTVARIGGDEFVILLESIHHIGDATSVAERIRDDLATPLPLADSPVNASVSIGIVQSSPVHQSPEQLLSEADAAMYRAKRSGGGRYEVYDPEQLVPVAHTVGEAELRHALERDELRLHFQPVVELATRKIVGLEALLRWEHPERGLLHPGEFISIAEAGDLTRQIGEWSLNEACRQLADWYERYGERAPRWISVNLSEKYFLDPALGSTIQRLLSESRLPVGALRVEISEAAIAEGDDPKLSALSVLSEIGVRISIDDFGTGASSLRDLHRLPIDSLKIDEPFVRSLPKNVRGDRLFRTFLKVAESLGASAIAEGVSTEEQLEELRRLGCVYGQGFLFSPALPAARYESILQRG